MAEHARTQALLGAPVSFEKGRGKSARAAVRALEAGEDWWKLVPEAEQERGAAEVARRPGEEEMRQPGEDRQRDDEDGDEAEVVS